MADVKISGLPASTVPLAGTEVLPIVQGGATKQVSIANVTAGRAIAATSITTDTYKAASSSGGALQNSGGTPQLQWGAGGGNNLSVDVAININPANAAVAISPTGTGTVTINPATAGTINNMVIGGTTAVAGTFTTVNKMAITAPATSSTLAVANNKTFTANNSLTLVGTDATTMTFPSTSATIARTDAAQSFTGNQTLSTGNLVIGTSGKGIDFSVTPDGSGTTTSELFADYEEGTFTPTYAFTGGGGSITHSATQFGTYRKIGKMVYCTIVMSTTSATLGTGDVQIDGLPYLLHSSAVYRNGCGSIGLAAGWVTLAPVQTYMIENLARLYLANTTGAATVGLPAANFNTGAGNTLFMSFSYPTVS